MARHGSSFSTRGRTDHGSLTPGVAGLMVDDTLRKQGRGGLFTESLLGGSGVLKNQTGSGARC